MKRLFLIPALMCIFMLNVAASCDGGDDQSEDGDKTRKIITSGTWRITSFIEDETDKTNEFTTYNFTFIAPNVLAASAGTNNFNGVWSINDDEDDDNLYSDVDLYIAFVSPDSFEELSEDWDIVSRTDSKVVLTHVSGGDGSIDLLTFEKN